MKHCSLRSLVAAPMLRAQVLPPSVPATPRRAGPSRAGAIIGLGAAMIAAAQATAQVTRTFVSQTADRNWEVASNWSPPGVPGPLDTVRFNGTVFLNSSTTVAAVEALPDGLLTGTGDLTISGRLGPAGAYQGAGRLILGPESVTTIAQSANVQMGRVLEVQGQLTVSGSLNVGLQTGGSLIVRPGGALILTGPAPGLQVIGGAVPYQVVNEGLIRRDGGGTTLQQNVVFSNQGEVQIENGSLTLLGPVVNLVGSTLTGGTWRLARAGRLQINSLANSGITAIAPGTTLSIVSPQENLVGAGIAGLIRNAGRLEFTGATFVSVPTLGNYPPSAVFENTGTISVGPDSQLSFLRPVLLGPGSVLQVRINSGVTPRTPMFDFRAGAVLGGRLAAQAAAASDGCFATPPRLYSIATATTPMTALSGSFSSVEFSPPENFGSFTVGTQAITVEVRPTIAGVSVPVGPVRIFCGGTLTLAGHVFSSSAPAALRWLYNGQPLTDGPGGPGGSTVSGATTTTLTITRPGDAALGSYALRATVGACSRTSSNVVVSVVTTDYNADGTTNVDDVADFVTDYFTTPAVPGGGPGGPPGGYGIGPCAGVEGIYAGAGFKCDFNGDCTLNTDDLSDFITAFFSGACT